MNNSNLVIIDTRYEKIDTIDKLEVLYDDLLKTYSKISDGIDPLSERLDELTGTNRVDDMEQLLEDVRELSRKNEECAIMTKVILMDNQLLLQMAAKRNIPFVLNTMEEFHRSINLSRVFLKGTCDNISDIIADMKGE